MNKSKTLISSLMILILVLLPCSQAISGEAQSTQEKVIYHVDDSTNARWALMLAKTYLTHSPDAKIVFVTYGPGVDFLLQGTKDKRDNTYDSSIFELTEEGIEFRICATTLDARDISQQRVLDGVQVVPDGIHEIVRLQTQEGFAYLKP